MNPASPTPTAQGPSLYGPFLGPLELHAPIGGRISKYASIICPDGDAEMGNWMVAERVRWDSYAEYMVLAVNSHARLTAAVNELIAEVRETRAHIVGARQDGFYGADHPRFDAVSSAELARLDAMIDRARSALTPQADTKVEP